MNLQFLLRLLGIIISVLIVLIYVVSLFRVMLFERKIKRLHIEMESKINTVKAEPILTSAIEGKIKNIKDDYSILIEKLERNRGYILDKLPFIKS